MTTCTIQFVIFSAGMANPYGLCQSCQPELTITDWSTALPGSSCLGGGVCVEDGGCQTDCLVNDAGALVGHPNPGDACQVCTAGQPDSWTELADSQSCGAGFVCLPQPAPNCACGSPIENSTTPLCMDPLTGAQGSCATIVPDGGPPQDGLIRLNPPNWQLAAGGAVLQDAVTGLEWQTTGLPAAGPDLTPDGGDVCRDLPPDAGSGWRLPGVHEAFGLMDLGTTGTVKPLGFQLSGGGFAWTRDLSAADGGVWVLSFNDATLFASISATILAYCVRPTGPPCGGGPLVPLDGGIAIDPTTGLTWYTTVFPEMFWGAALETCAQLDASSVGSFDGGWRLPSFKELLSVVNYGQLAAPLADPALGLDPVLAVEWSSTPNPGSVASRSMGMDDGAPRAPPVPAYADGG